MKTKEELNALKEEVETLSKKLAELTEEELTLVAGGYSEDNTKELEDLLNYRQKFIDGKKTLPDLNGSIIGGMQMSPEAKQVE